VPNILTIILNVFELYAPGVEMSGKPEKSGHTSEMPNLRLEASATATADYEMIA